MTEEIPHESDFVIVGGGAAGCVLAARLSQDRGCRVLLLEAGPELESTTVSTPGTALQLLGSDAVYGASPCLRRLPGAARFYFPPAAVSVVAEQDEFQVGSDLIRAGAGSAVWIPPGTPHGFRVRSETARALNMYTPGGLDDTISMLATPTAGRTLPSEGAVKEATPEQEEAFLRRIRGLHTQTWTDVPNLLAGEDGVSRSRARQPEHRPHARPAVGARAKRRGMPVT